MKTEDESYEKRKAGRLKRVVLFYLLPTLIIALLIAGVTARKAAVDARRQSELGRQEAVVNVVTWAAAPSAISDRINLPGVTTAWVKLNVLSQVAGEVTEKLAREGALVRQGDVLALIDARKYQNAYDSAKASLASALATQSRLTALYREELASKADVDAIDATVENYRAAVENAALDLEHCRVRAPIAGVVNHVFIETGQVLGLNQEVAEILQIDPIKVTVGIPETDMPAVRELTEFAVTISALEGRTVTGRKHFLSRTADPLARLYDLEILLDNPQARILPDMFVRVDVVKRTVDQALVLPLYVITSNGVHTVMVVEDGRARPREVTLGIVEGFNAEITSGLQAGDAVIVVGQKQVADGQKVNVTRTVTDPAGAMR